MVNNLMSKYEIVKKKKSEVIMVNLTNILLMIQNHDNSTKTQKTMKPRAYNQMLNNEF